MRPTLYKLEPSDDEMMLVLVVVLWSAVLQQPPLTVRTCLKLRRLFENNLHLLRAILMDCGGCFFSSMLSQREKV